MAAGVAPIVKSGVGRAVAAPARAIVWVLAVLLSEMVRFPVRVPLAVGVKVTVTVQTSPIESVAGQVFVSAKSLEAAIPEMTSGAFPAFASETEDPALVVPTSCAPKLIDGALKLITGALLHTVIVCGHTLVV